MIEHTFPAEIARLPEAMGVLEQFMDSIGVPLPAQMHVSVSFEEMFVNVASYAYPGGSGDVTVQLSAENNTLCIHLIDSGIPFDPLQRADPDTALSTDERPIGGLGIFMVKKSMDTVAYAYADKKNIFTMTKNF